MNLLDLAEKLNELTDELLSWSGVIQIGYKLEADALLATAIFGKTLLSREQPYVLFQCENISEEISDRDGQNYVFIGHHNVDLNQIDENISFIAIANPEEAEAHPRIINAKLYDADRPEITLTSMAYLMCESLVSHDPTTRDYITLLPLIAQQTLEMKSKPVGLQEQIYEQAKESGLIDEYSTIGILGSDIYTINDALVYSQDPFLPNLTDNESQVIELLAKADVVAETSEGYRKFSDLEHEELKNLNSELVNYIQHNSGLKIKQLNFIAKKIVLKKEYEESILNNIWDFARAILDAINRKKYTLGLAVILGNRSKQLQELTKIYKEERQACVSSFDFLIDKREEIVELDNLNYLKTDKKVNWYNASSIAGMVIAGGLSSNKIPFVLIVPGPPGKMTLGIKASSDISIKNGLYSLVDSTLKDQNIEVKVEGGEYEVQCSIPEDEWENVIVDLNTKLGDN